MDLISRLFGYRMIYGGDGKPLPERSRFRVVGLAVSDDETTKTTVIALETPSVEGILLAQDVEETRTLEVAPLVPTGGWSVNADLQPQNVVEAAAVSWPLRLPAFSRLKEVRLLVRPAEHFAVPFVKPRLSVRVVEHASGAASEVIAISDPTSTVPGWNQDHAINLDLSGFTGGGMLVEGDKFRYVLKLVAESGSGAVTGLVVLSVQLVWVRKAGSKLGQD
jgi:hypothetical protein